MITKIIHAIIYFIALIPLTSNAAPLLGNPISATPTFQDFMEKILTLIIQISVMVLTIMLFYVGYLFVTAQGNDEQLNKAKEAFKWTLVGGAVLLGAGAISFAVGSTIGAIIP